MSWVIYTRIHGAFSVLRTPLVGPFGERDVDGVIDHDTAKTDRGSKMTILASTGHVLIAKEKFSGNHDECGRVDVQTLLIACAWWFARAVADLYNRGTHQGREKTLSGHILTTLIDI